MPAKALDLTGQRYGRLVALTDTGRLALRNHIWKFKCDCGNEIERASGEVRRGTTLSCGCLRADLTTERMKALAPSYNVARATHRMTATRTYVSWDSMKQRCLNPNHKSFDVYGNAGISVCERWLESFESFLADLGERPPNTTLDRFPNMSGNYEPGNCRWATPQEQANNRRSARNILYKGRTQTMAEWAREFSIGVKVLAHRLNAGWGVKAALTTKVDYRNKGSSGVEKSLA